MRALDLKLRRDIQRMWPQLLAIAAVIAAGVAVCITMLSALASLESSRNRYYDAADFADLFASVKRAPESVADRLREIPGIDLVETRIVAEVTLDVPGLAEPAVGRLISIPDESLPALNRLLIRSGDYPAPGRGDQVVASEAFAAAHHLTIGHTIVAIMNGRWRRLTVTGIAISPEYVYSIRPGDLFPDDKRFGALWMRRQDLAAALDMTGAFNDVVCRLSRAANTQDVIARVDHVLDRYGGVGAYARKDQASAWYLENELSQLANMGRVTPFIFAAVAAFLLHVVTARLVLTQREQIGVLKAFGYSNLAIARHYGAFALSIGAAGIAMGIAAGAWAGSEWTRLYAQFFRFPSLPYRLPVSIALETSAAAALIAILASIGAAHRAASIAPAEAMRPPAPPLYRRSVLARYGLEQRLALPGRIVVRNLQRRPFRTSLSIVAVALAIAIVIVGLFTVDAVHYITDVQFDSAQRQDVTVTFKEVEVRSALRELNHMPGVMRVEPLRVVPVRLRSGTRVRRIGLTGISRDATLARVIDDKLAAIELPPSGLVVNAALASALGVGRGDDVMIEVLEGTRRTHAAVVSTIVPEYLGLAAYMDIDTLNRLMGEGSIVSGAHLQTDSAAAPALYARLKTTPGVGGVVVSGVARRSFEETVAAVISTVTTMFGIFGAAIAFAVIYNNSRIAFAERARELGSLHVLGFSHGEMAQIILGEMAIVTIVAVPLGIVTGRVLASLVVVLFSTELARMPLVIGSATNLIAVAITLASALASGFATWRQIVALDVVSALKAPE